MKAFAIALVSILLLNTHWKDHLRVVSRFVRSHACTPQSVLRSETEAVVIMLLS